MLVAASTSRLDPFAENAFRVSRSRKPSQKLSVLEVTGNVIGVFSKQCFEVLHSRRCIALGRAFHGQSVTGKSVLRVGGQEFFE